MAVLRTLRTVITRSGSIAYNGLRRLGRLASFGVVSGFMAGVVGLAVVMFAAEYFGLL